MTILYGLCWNIDSRKIIWPPRAHFGSENESLKGLKMNSAKTVCFQLHRCRIIYVHGTDTIERWTLDRGSLGSNLTTDTIERWTLNQGTLGSNLTTDTIERWTLNRGSLGSNLTTDT